MTTTKTTLSDAPSVAGDDGEAIPQTVESPTGSPVADTDGMSWYVACVRVNYEKKFMLAIEQDFQGRGLPIEAWVPTERRVVVNSRGKRCIREFVVLSTFVFVRVAVQHLTTSVSVPTYTRCWRCQARRPPTSSPMPSSTISAAS